MKMHRGACCVAVGCNMRPGTNLLSKVRLFKFPKDPARRQRWEAAVKRENWKPNASSRLCNLHFITGSPSPDPLHPDFVPSIFTHKEPSRTQEHLPRYERHTKRMKTAPCTSSSYTPLMEMDENVIDIGDPQSSSSAIVVSEVKTFKESSIMTELTMADILKLEKQNEAYKSTNDMLQETTKSHSATSQIISNFKAFHFYTKLPSVRYFYGLLALIMDGWKVETKTALEPEGQLLLVLMKLRLALLNEDLSFRFNIGKGTVSSIFREWITQMAVVMRKFIMQPSRETIAARLPKCFLEAGLNNVSCIVDCSEIFMQRPFNLDARGATYSNYKHHNTVKFIISCCPSGGITFISKTYGGRISDKEITKQSGFLEIIQQNDVILADRGFRIQELLALKNAQIIVPASTKGKKQLGGGEVTSSRKVARVRIHIERCIGRLKTYGILKQTWPIQYLSCNDGEMCTGDSVLVVIAALCNIGKSNFIK